MLEETRDGLFMPSRSREPSAIAVEEAREEESLIDQLRSSFYRKQTRLIKILMLLSGIKVVAAQPEDGHQSGDQRQGHQSLRNILQPITALPKFRPISCKPGGHSWLGRIIWPPKMGLLMTIYRHYAFVKLLLLSILLLKRSNILSHLNSEVQLRAHTTNSCALNEDLYFNAPAYQDEFEQLKSLEAWLKFLGASMISLPEFSVPGTFVSAILTLFYHHVCQLLLTHCQHRVDTLCFMLDPLGERRRMSAELRNIVHELILSQSNHKNNLYYGFENSRELSDVQQVVLGVRRSASGSNGSKCSELGAVGGSHMNAAASRRRLLNDQAHRLRYLQSLVKIRRLKQVDPYILTSKWHRTLLRLVDLLRLVIWSIFTLTAMMLILASLYDLCTATRLRLEMVACAEWHPGGIRIVTFDHLYLDELKSTEQLDTYKTHDGSTMSFLKLALFVESTKFFSLKWATCWFEGLLANYLFSIEWILSASLHLIGTIENIVWLYQLDQQVRCAAEEAAVHAHLAHRFGHSQEADERLLNTLTLVYLNYELFRRRQDDYLMLTDRINISLTLLAVMSCLIIYFSGLSLGNSSPILVISLCSFLLATLNLFLVASSYRMKQMEKIMGKASRVLAHCSSGPIQLSYPVELWRRQVLAFEESCQRYASRLLGMDVTYETVISLNAYAVALMLILLKPQHSPPR